MHVHMSIHRPKPGKEPDLVGSMRRFKAALEGKPGLVRAMVTRDTRSGALVGLVLWESRAAFEAGVAAARAAVEHDPFDEWEDRDPDVFLLEEL